MLRIVSALQPNPERHQVHWQPKGQICGVFMLSCHVLCCLVPKKCFLSVPICVWQMLSIYNITVSSSIGHWYRLGFGATVIDSWVEVSYGQTFHGEDGWLSITLPKMLLLWRRATYESGRCIVSGSTPQIRNKEQIVLVTLTYPDINDKVACRQRRQSCLFLVKGQHIWMKARFIPMLRQ